MTTNGFDDVPVPIGLPERPAVTLPGNEALLRPEQGKGKGISYRGKSGWANDWIDNWTDPAAYPAWPIGVVTPGDYEIILHYSSPPENISAVIEARIQDENLQGTIDEAHDPEYLPSPDRFQRPEVYEKVWKPLSLGVVTLDKGKSELVLRAKQIVGCQMPEIKAVEVRPRDPVQ